MISLRIYFFHIIYSLFRFFALWICKTKRKELNGFYCLNNFFIQKNVYLVKNEYIFLWWLLLLQNSMISNRWRPQEKEERATRRAFRTDNDFSQTIFCYLCWEIFAEKFCSRRPLNIENIFKTNVKLLYQTTYYNI